MVKWRIGGWIRQGNIGEEQKAAVSGSARRIIMDGPMLCRMVGDHVRADEVPTSSSSSSSSAVPVLLFGFLSKGGGNAQNLKFELRLEIADAQSHKLRPPSLTGRLSQ